MLEGNEDGVPVLALEPLLCLQGRIWACRVRVQVILEEVRLEGRGRETVVRERYIAGSCGAALDAEIILNESAK